MSIFKLDFSPGYFYNLSNEIEADLNEKPTETNQKDWTPSSSMHWSNVEDVLTPSIIAVVVLVGVVCGVWKWCRGT